ncbi:MAG TPA: sulfide/dihydroorotate dehydrogenase-like FAD/NAD-binding protein [Candidatus Omnitrophota bacterium]|nr:sulfide/dihydroorotate dehydrogenase-like FAD/NAD-binding protein [Candidatus Omnitrophota bacterium]HQO58046.1 sulfide/dihydroorotate dehydrogenase-like FAD/NAD-binding protein [Candidatus Omnitrophota bacterium]HQP11294.1 sulfide/dihydroorotate dehydrogenase-like FAD/NAD-binding protein [Candidatus Omnitrophota bacterium]
MFTIINRQLLAKDMKRLDIVAETVAAKALPGQFVIVMPEKNAGWLPLTIVENDPLRGTVSLVFQERGPATRRLGSLSIQESVYAVMGPLGKPATIKTAGTVVCAASGVSIASILPVCRALKRCENKVIGLIGAENKNSVLLETQMRLACHKLMITTEDGTYERKGTVLELLKEILDEERVKLVYVIGPAAMMEEACRMTRGKKIETFIQANTIMHCGSGICGSCRLDVDSKPVLSCVDGPEFNGHEVDFEKLKARLWAHDHSACLSEDRPPDGGSMKKFLSGLWGD